MTNVQELQEIKGSTFSFNKTPHLFWVAIGYIQLPCVSFWIKSCMLILFFLVCFRYKFKVFNPLLSSELKPLNLDLKQKKKKSKSRQKTFLSHMITDDSCINSYLTCRQWIRSGGSPEHSQSPHYRRR